MVYTFSDYLTHEHCKGHSQTLAAIFYNLIWDLVSHYFGPTLSVRSIEIQPHMMKASWYSFQERWRYILFSSFFFWGKNQTWSLETWW